MTTFVSLLTFFTPSFSCVLELTMCFTLQVIDKEISEKVIDLITNLSLDSVADELVHSTSLSDVVG